MDLTDIFINIFIILFLLFVNGFFVSAEFSLVKVRKTRLEQLANEGNINAKRALKLVNETNKMLAEFNESKNQTLVSTVIIELSLVVSFFSLIPYQKKLILEYNDVGKRVKKEEN